MERPQARIIDQQHVESQREITGWEAEQILRKYGHQPHQHSSLSDNDQSVQDTSKTFEEMLQEQEAKLREEVERKRQLQNAPRPATFDGSRGYDSETRYSTDEETGFGFKIEISSDMKIPKY